MQSNGITITYRRTTHSQANVPTYVECCAELSTIQTHCAVHLCAQVIVASMKKGTCMHVLQVCTLKYWFWMIRNPQHTRKQSYTRHHFCSQTHMHRSSSVFVRLFDTRVCVRARLIPANVSVFVCKRSCVCECFFGMSLQNLFHFILFLIHFYLSCVYILTIWFWSCIETKINKSLSQLVCTQQRAWTHRAAQFSSIYFLLTLLMLLRLYIYWTFYIAIFV